MANNEKQLMRILKAAEKLPLHQFPGQNEILVQAGAAALTHWNKNPVLRWRLGNSSAAYQMFILYAIKRATNERLEPKLCMAFGLNDDDFEPTKESRS
jgi:hypothetical protein